MSEFDELMKKKAVALKYDPLRNGAPIVVASGMGYLAERITEAAMESGVPVYEDDSLATLLTQLKLGASIPVELYQAVVDIYLYFLNYVPEEGTVKKVEAGTTSSGGEAMPEETGEDMFGENGDSTEM
mgnify:CR=1 FL=1